MPHVQLGGGQSVSHVPHAECSVLSAVRRYLQSRSSRSGAAEAMSALLQATEQLPVNNMEAWERRLRLELSLVYPRSAFAFWNRWRRPDPEFSWLNLCSGSGFVRERALWALSDGAPNGFFCALAMRRLNEWVPEVRAAARDRLIVVAERSRPQDVVDALWCVLPHCSSWGRMRDVDSQILAHVVEVKQVASALKFKIISAASGPASLVLAQSGRSSALDPSLYEIAKMAVQPTTRARAYRCLLEAKATWVVGRKWDWIDKRWSKGRFTPIHGERAISVVQPDLELLGAAGADRSTIVRRVAAEFLVRELDSLGGASMPLAELLASDPSPSVAEHGMFALARLRG